MQHVNNSSTLPHLQDFSFIHIGLLNQDKKEIDGTGWNHHEANEMTDMAEIFQEFKGKALIFDGLGPFIDENGNIHLPQKNTTKTLTLNPFFVNSSVQGHKDDNKNLTAIHINEQTFDELKKYSIENENFSEILAGMSLVFEKKNHTSYQTAIDLIYWARMAGFMISTGCLSAKDRTGFTCAADSVLNQMEAFPIKAKRKFMKAQMKENAPGVLVVQDNNPETHIMKVEPFFIPGVTDTPRGKVLRAGMWAKQAAEILKERKRIKQKLKPKETVLKA